MRQDWLAAEIECSRLRAPAASPTVLSVVGSPRSSASLSDSVIRGNAMLLSVLDLRCIGREGPAASAPSVSSRAFKEVEDDIDSIEWRVGEWRSVGECVRDDSEVRACS